MDLASEIDGEVPGCAISGNDVHFNSAKDLFSVANPGLQKWGASLEKVLLDGNASQSQSVWVAMPRRLENADWTLNSPPPSLFCFAVVAFAFFMLKPESFGSREGTIGTGRGRTESSDVGGSRGGAVDSVEKAFRGAVISLHFYLFLNSLLVTYSKGAMLKLLLGCVNTRVSKSKILTIAWTFSSFKALQYLKTGFELVGQNRPEAVQHGLRPINAWLGQTFYPKAMWFSTLGAFGTVTEMAVTLSSAMSSNAVANVASFFQMVQFDVIAAHAIVMLRSDYGISALFSVWLLVYCAISLVFAYRQSRGLQQRLFAANLVLLPLFTYLVMPKK